MATNPRVFELLEEILDSGRKPEEVCADCPELLAEVQRRWQAFRVIDEEFAALLPESTTRDDPDGSRPLAPPNELPQLPGYRVDGVLGSGGMGVVYRAWDVRLNRPVALKMLLAGAQARPTELERFQREAQAVAALRHPNVVQVVAVLTWKVSFQGR
jgi:eukaryotic-like serine/threonine-protein kinase